MPSAKTKIAILTATAGVFLAGGATAASAMPENSGKRKVASVSGAADFRLTFWPDKDVRHFEFDAEGAPYTRPITGAPKGLPTDARGTVKISHYVHETNKTFRAEAVVDCLATSPGNATLTAKVTRADDEVKDWVGNRLGFSVQDAGKKRDRVGLSWVVSNLDDSGGEWKQTTVGTCMAPAAFAPVTKGGYTVKHADLLPMPQR